ncbi:haloacid dehalogenase [Marinosulfonomonas sp. PRT-SC04]|nr:haloacid dehalogenase [Marinosulfonomonas sp. PRT-SC04]
MKTVIFDLDGTLADTSGDLLEAANACFRTLGHGDMLDLAADQATAFAGGRAMLRLGFSRLNVDKVEVLIDQQFPLFIEHYRQNIDHHTVIYDGVRSAVQRLLDAGYKVGICTNKPEDLAETLMQRLGLREMFGALVGADTLPTRKPDAAPYLETVARVGGTVSRSVLIGDTVTDRETARAAGVPCVLVTFGPTGREVETLQPEALLDHFDALFEVVEGLID